MGPPTWLPGFLLVSIRLSTETRIFIEVPIGRPTGTSPFSQCSVTRPARIGRNLKWHQAQQMHLVASQTATICSRSSVLSMSNMLCYGMQIGQYRSSKINHRLLQPYEKKRNKTVSQFVSRSYRAQPKHLARAVQRGKRNASARSA